MKDTMIERVAKAMQLETVNKPFSWENAARAAIETMRESTPEMLQKFTDNAEKWDANFSWKAMINTALKE